MQQIAKYLVFGLLVVLIHGNSDAQQRTWNGLSYGMKVEDVVAAPQLKDLYLEQVSGTLRSTKDWMFVEPKQMAPMPFTVELDFGSNGLERVLLHLNLKAYAGVVVTEPNTHPERPELSSEVAFSLGTEALGRTLIGKYGKPLTESKDCAAEIFPSIVHRSNEVCAKVWNSEGQKIEYDWLLPSKTVEIIYLKADNGL